MSLRLFGAIPLSAALKDQFATLQSRLRLKIEQGPLRVQWTDPSLLHITLKFLGSCPEISVKGIQEAFAAVAQVTKPFTMGFQGLGCFPLKGEPRIVWLGIDQGGIELTALAQAMDTALVSLGFEKEQRDFHPHITIGRVKTLRGGNGLRRILAQAKVPAFSDYRVNEVVLMR